MSYNPVDFLKKIYSLDLNRASIHLGSELMTEEAA